MPPLTVPSLPATAPAIPISDRGPDPATYRVLSPSGAEIARGYTKDPWHELGTPLIAFATPPSPGDYFLEYRGGCENGAPTSNVQQVPLTITAGVPVPVSVGTFETANRSVQTKQIWTYSGACFVTIEYVSFDILLHLSPDQEPFQAVTSYAISLDGQESGVIRFSSALGPTTIPIASINGPCDGQDHQTGGLSLGTHSVSVKSHIAGTKAEGPVTTMSFDVSCDATTPATTAPATTAPAGDAGAPAAANAQDGGGCSLARAGSPAMVPAFAVVALALLRRRRIKRDA